MALRRRLILLFAVAALSSMGASYRTTNFVVEAPTPQIAQQIGQAAEYYRKEKAIQWLGREMPAWPEPCPLQVKVTMSGAGGATSFAFDQGQVLGQNMNIEGSLDRLLASVLPHEVTHTVFAHYFRQPVPRWADEGGSVLSEDEVERKRHDKLVREILNTPGRAFPLRRLFSLRDYPGDVMVLYAEGYSVSQFLVDSSNRQTFLAFVSQGTREGWDNAVRAHYRYNSVEELEQAWLTHMRNTRQPPPGELMARNTAPTQGETGRRVIVRHTLPPNLPMLSQPTPIFRGQTPASDAEAGDRRPEVGGRAMSRPDQLPDASSNPNTSSTMPRDTWQAAGTQPSTPSVVRLGPLQTLHPPVGEPR